MTTVLKRRRGDNKLRVVTGKDFVGGEEKLICLQSLIKKLTKIKSRNPVSFFVDQHDKVLVACRQKIDHGIKYVKVRIVSAEELQCEVENVQLLRFVLIDDFEIPDKIRAFCADVFRELSEVSKQEMLTA